ncbi:MAG: hypothetical protein ACREIB_00130, partial [Pseudomonadota bacterium]
MAGIPEVLERAVFRAMEKAPEDRFQSAADFIDALAPVVSDTSETRPYGPRRPHTGGSTIPQSPGRSGPDSSGAISDIASDGALLTRHDEDPGLPVPPPAPAQTNVLPFSAMQGERPRAEDETLPGKAAPPATGEGKPIRFPTRGSAALDPKTADSAEAFPIAKLPGAQASRQTVVVEGSAARVPESLKKPGRITTRGVLRALGVLFILLAAVAAWVLWLQPLSPEAIRALVESGRQAMEAGRLSGPGPDTAVAYIEEALDAAPADPAARALLSTLVDRQLASGKKSLEQGEIGKARAALDEAQRLVREYAIDASSVAQLRAAVDTEQARLADLARKDAEKVVRARRIEELLVQARSALEAGRYSEAAGPAQQVLSLEAGHTEARRILNDVLAAVIQRAEEALTRGELENAKRGEQEARGLTKNHELADQAVSDLSASIAAQEKALAEQAANAKRMDALVEQALRAASLDRWTEPQGDNVAEYAQQALALAPPDTTPTQLLSGVLEAGVGRAETALKAGDLKAATELVESLRKVASVFKVNLPGLDRISTEITAEEDRRRQIAEQEKQKAELAAKAQSVAKLTDQAIQAAAQNRWTAPRGDNAVEYAREALALAPPGTDPAQLLSGVFEAGINRAETALKVGDPKAAVKAVESVQEFATAFKVKLSKLEALSAEIAAEEDRLRRIAEQEQQQAEQAAKAQRVSEITDKATQAGAEGRWTAPRGNNAVEYARQALALAPPGTDPAQLLNGVFEAGARSAETALKAGDPKAATKAVQAVQQFAKTFKVNFPKLEALSTEIAAEEARRKAAEALAAREAEVRRLAEKAERALAANRLASPASDNAVAYLRQLTRLDAQNTDATRIASAVAARFVRLAEDALKRRAPRQAETHRMSAIQIAYEFRISDKGLKERIAAVQTELDAAATAAVQQPRELEEQRSRDEAAAKREAERQEQARQQDEERKKEVEVAAQQRAQDQAERLEHVRGQAAAALAAGDLSAAAAQAGKMLGMAGGKGEARQVLQQVVGRYVALGELAVGRGDRNGGR